MRWISSIAAMILLAGCATWPPDVERETAPRYANPDSHLLFLDRLADAGDMEMREIGTVLQGVIETDPSADQRLRYALWLGRADHDGHDARAAAVLLDELLVEPGRGLLPASRALARIERERLSVRLELEREIRDLEDKLRSLTDLERELEGSGEQGE